MQVNHPCLNLNNWILYNELDIKFGKITAEACVSLMTISQSEHNNDKCDCISHKKYCSKESHNSNCSDSNCILERMERKVLGMNPVAKVALLAWFLLMARKLTGKMTRPVGMSWEDVKDYLGRVAIITDSAVDNNKENSELIMKIAKEIDIVVKRSTRRYTM